MLQVVEIVLRTLLPYKLHQNFVLSHFFINIFIKMMHFVESLSFSYKLLHAHFSTCISCKLFAFIVIDYLSICECKVYC